MFKSSKSGNKGKQRKQENFSSKIFLGAQARETLEKIDDTCLTIINFKKYADELDSRKDKFEKLIKISRDITIESKRIIFLLHTIDMKSKKESILKEAEERLENLLSKQCKLIAEELNGEDFYQYHKAFSPGIQEFMESFIYFNYLKSGEFFHWDYYQNKMKYIIDVEPQILLPNNNPNTEIECKRLADVSGELMRKCINSLGSGEVESCLETCKFVRHLHTCFLTVGTWEIKEMFHKAFTLKQNLLKMERLCYNIHVRGSEIPKYMLVDIDGQKTYEDEGDGFFD